MHVGSWNCTDMGKWWEMEWLAVRNICVPCNDGYKVHMIADLCKGLQFTIPYAVKNGPFEHPIVNDSVACKYRIEQTSIAVAKAQLQKILFSKKHIWSYFYVNFYLPFNGKVPNSLKFTSSLHRPIEPVPKLCHENLRAFVCSLKRSGSTETTSTPFRVFLISLSKLWELIMWQVDSSTIPIFSFKLYINHSGKTTKACFFLISPYMLNRVHWHLQGTFLDFHQAPDLWICTRKHLNR